MLTRFCMSCGSQKEDISAIKCNDCVQANMKIEEEARVQGWDYWTTQRAKQQEEGARRKVIGMSGKTDPRMYSAPIDMSAMRDRLR